MTYNDLDMSHNKTSINCHAIRVELFGKVTTHYIHGQSRTVAIHNLLQTGWYINSARNIVE